VAAPSAAQGKGALAMRVTDLIAQDHRRVREMFLELERMDAGDGERRALLDRIIDELDVHARAEEDVFYPAVRAASRRIDDAQAAHDYLRSAIAAFRALDVECADFTLGVRLIKGIVLSHVLEEESGIFMDAQRLGGDELERLGVAMQERKEALTRTRGKRAA
jgi:hemerythrin superfamily protein